MKRCISSRILSNPRLRANILFQRRLQKLSSSVTNELPQFNQSIFEIAKTVTQENKESDNLRTSFFQAINDNNSTRVLKILSDLKNDSANDFKDQEQLEFLQIALNFYIENKIDSISIISTLIQDYSNLINYFKNDETHSNHVNTLIKAVLKISETTNSTPVKFTMRKLFNQFIEQYNVNPHVSEKKVSPERSAADGEMKIKTSRNSTSIEPYLDDFNMLTFEKACAYISENKFTWKNKAIKEHLFKFYETLPTNEKHEFMERYISFNETKQSQLEAHFHQLQQKESTPQQFKVNFFAKEPDSILSWVEEASLHLESVIKFESPVTDDEKVLSHFKPFLEYFTIKSLIYLIIQTLIGEAYKEEVVLSEILSKLRFYYRKNIQTIKCDSYKIQLLKFIPENSFDKLSNILINSVIVTCKVKGDDGSDSIFQVEKEPNKQMVFAMSTIYNNSKKKLVIKINPTLQNLINTSSSYNLNEFSHHFPLLHPPKPWLNTKIGAFNEIETNFISGYDSLHKSILTKLQKQGKLDSGFRCLDQMGKTAWCINPDILKIFNEIMELPQGFLDIPPKTIIEKSKKKSIELKSLRKNYEMILNLANSYGKNGDILYHVYMFDFRGRVYALSPLSHYGGDLTRSLFNFWFSQPLGKNGFYWIKYQLVSMFGNGYLSEDCEKFVEKFQNEIISSANDPISNKWWMKGDEPFSTLSLCFEIKKILEFESNGGNIEEYLCRVPIHQDGSCNGLQHYAALAADEAGGKAVNLLPMETKQDVYSTVRDIVEEKIKNDIDENLLAGKDLDSAKLILKILDRKLVKRPVMTTVYGVTLNGASKQILENIESLKSNHYENPTNRKYDQTIIDQLSTFNLKTTNYLAKKILNSINELFCNAKNLEDWLVLNAKRILTSYNIITLDFLELKQSNSIKDLKNLSNWYKSPINFDPINWTSPAGFPIIQIYRKFPKQIVKGLLGSTMKFKTSELTSMDRRKHELAIAPNFIHSLDAAHMFMTCNEANNQKITFTSIHDSYWTYPNNVEKLSKILREQFVELYSFDYMKEIKLKFEKQMENSFQLCYFEKSKNLELAGFLKDKRSSYNERKINDQLNIELRELTSQKDLNFEIQRLIEKYNSKLYYIVGNKIFEYSSNLKTSQVEIKEKPKNLVPILTPVQVLDLPKKGTLNIEKVKESKYFFS
ncbi:uncharacterized protein KGF55_004317 [Candida pseudojiufengensis]|uniref:uncharacterized protein n=1 Tax=Candida pseudojiufengensis TaxID=497109 RepID=UPI0022245B74|nr:uncharacterized protein KGF55_004317 [Candida pseudojiufengensis]KAI5960747.1 hypothetical protein KGF55_004317 [Candida pseudojiufengensis]